MKKTPNILFPFPHLLDGDMFSGSLIVISKKCSNCRDRICMHTVKTGEIQICNKGYNYIKVNNKVTIFGVILKNYSFSTKCRKKVISEHRMDIVDNNHFNNSIEVLKKYYSEIDLEIEEKKEIVLEKYIDEEQYKNEFLSSLKEEIQKGLSFVHDYKQINSQISQNINVILETKYSGVNS